MTTVYYSSFENNTCFVHSRTSTETCPPLFGCFLAGGGFSHWHGICICACLLRCFFCKLWYSDWWVSSKWKEPKLNWVYLRKVYCEKHPIWANLDAFLSKMVYWWVGNWAKIWYEKIKFTRSGRHNRIQCWQKYPPPVFSTADSRSNLVFKTSFFGEGEYRFSLSYFDSA